jgi:hypothetical protein
MARDWLAGGIGFMHDKLLNRLTRLILAKTAFAQARVLAEQLMANRVDPEDLTFSPQIAGVVVTYARSFTSAQGIGALEEAFSRFDDTSLRDMHSKLVDMRNKLYAHRDFGGAQKFTIEPSGPKPYQVLVRIDLNGIPWFSPSAPEMNPQLLPEVVRLCRFQENRATSAVLDLLPHLQNGKKYPPGSYTLGVDFP